jgi:hypothetical protein
MPIDSDRITELLRRPAESLNVEVKTWLDPTKPDDVAKIVKATFALHNRNGGYLVVGYDNQSLTPDRYPFADAVEVLFHSDVIQGIISRYASFPIEVAIELRELEGQTFPVIFVAEGVRTPLVVKRDLRLQDGRHLLKEGDVFVRTLAANGTPSTARAGPSDWADLMEICFENREADIGRFFRRHLADRDFTGLAELLGGGSATQQETLRTLATAVLETGDGAFDAQVAQANMSAEYKDKLNGLTLTVALVLGPQRPEGLPSDEFLNKFHAGNPQYTGWPTWLDSRSFNDPAERPRVIQGAWEAFIEDLGNAWMGGHLDFMRIDPKGQFYLRRLMQDDLTDKVTPRTALDVVLMIYRVVEVLATGLSVARSSGWEKEGTGGFLFRWTGLAGRKLVPWVNVFRSPGVGARESSDNEATSYVEVPLDAPHSALAPYVEKAVQPLFVSFQGYTPRSDLIEECVRKVIERKMDS